MKLIEKHVQESASQNRKMTQEEQLTEFTRKICKAVEYSDMEYDLTTEQMIGVLEVAKQMIIAKFLNES
nr:hypothetical protein [uncultured Mediterranean phage uvMED]